MRNRTQRTIYLLLALSLLSCGGEKGSADAAPEPGGDASEPPGDAAPPSGPAPTRAPRAKMAVTAPLELPHRNPRLERELLRGPQLTVVDATSTPPRLLVKLASRVPEQPPRVALIDVETGDELAQVTRVREASERAGVARAWVGDEPRPALLRLEDGALFEPTPRDPQGEPLENVVILTATGSDEIVLVGTARDGTHYYGRWADLSHPEVVLELESPVGVRGYDLDITSGSFEVREGDGSPGRSGFREGDCVRARLTADEPAQCRAWGDRERNSTRDRDLAWLAGDWVTEGREGYTRASNSVTGARQWVAPPDCRAQLAAALVMPPRALVACETNGHLRRYSLWRPGASAIFHVPVEEERAFSSIGVVSHPIIPATSLDWRRESSDLWIDMIRGLVVETDPLAPLATGSQPQLTLATRTEDGTIDLVLLDFERREQRQIARYEDCPGELQLLGRREQLFAIGCMEQPTERFVFELQWAELLDLRRNQRWRTELMIEELLADGRAIASDRRRVAAESETNATRVVLLTFNASNAPGSSSRRRGGSATE